MNDDFRIYLRTEQPTYRLGEPVLITFQLINVSERDYRLLAENTPFESDEVFQYFTVRREGELVPYDGRFVKRGEPVESSYRPVAAGETVSVTDDLTTAYPIDTAGTYTVTLDAEIADAIVTGGGNTSQAGVSTSQARSREAHEGFRLDQVSVTFDVVGDDEPRLTVAEKVRRGTDGPRPAPESLAKLIPGVPVLIGGTAAEKNAARQAHENAGVFAERSMYQLLWAAGATNTQYAQWFGTHDAVRYATVRQHYTDISAVIAGQTVTYDLTGAGCQPGWYAYTYRNTRKVWFCSGFWSAPVTGTDSKLGTVVHELSHAVCSTDDLVYGESGAHTLASTNPANAIRNADNHEYFAERLAEQVITAPILWDNGKAYVFVAGKYFRIDIALDKVDHGPASITSGWTGVFPDRVDAGVMWPNGQDAYFFRGSQYVRFNVAQDAVAPGYPLEIGPYWQGLFPAAIDACLVWPGGQRVYFFRGSEYSRFDVDDSHPLGGKVPAGYPRQISEGWPGIWTANLTGAVTWTDGNVYFFRGPEYMTYQVSDDTVTGPWPLSTKWTGLP
ncbi:M35 family metallo-endopeptidase [Streptomyces sp. SCL15-6]|uniref:M35 family metallo-endopeptidase n=1 Tax=Streptomyces sp. SCL15-6 TaxID=2967222 RepID=UPI002965DED5|nr:M35 family metallo-endopeptidase [Streptomyces sp. SCL15-6]